MLFHYSKWENWFAWYPVQVLNSGRRCWLKKIYRRKVYFTDWGYTVHKYQGRQYIELLELLKL